MKNKFKSLEKTKRGGQHISLFKYSNKKICVETRERSLKEGWWREFFPLTEKGYNDALKYYNEE